MVKLMTTCSILHLWYLLYRRHGWCDVIARTAHHRVGMSLCNWLEESWFLMLL